jgi:hypothetical protein
MNDVVKAKFYGRVGFSILPLLTTYIIAHTSSCASFVSQGVSTKHMFDTSI